MALRQHLTTIGNIEIVSECTNGFEAIKAATELQPDVMLLDVQMPKIDGFEVLEVIGREIAVVFVRRMTSSRCAPSKCTRWTTC